MDPDQADHPLAVKGLEDDFVEPEPPEIKWVKDVLFLWVVGKAPGDARVSSRDVTREIALPGSRAECLPGSVLGSSPSNHKDF